VNTARLVTGTPEARDSINAILPAEARHAIDWAYQEELSVPRHHHH
jgi:hypothetical protein